MSTWVLVRGLTRESGHWGAFIASLQARFPKDRVVLLDLPGNGAEHTVASPLTVDAMATRCRKMLAQRGVAPPYRVLAMSLGAMVTVAWAQQAPHELEAVVLVNTSLRPFSPFWHRLQPGAWRPMLGLALRRFVSREKEMVIYALTCNTRPAPARVIDDWVEIRRRRPVSARNAMRQLWAAMRFRAPRTCPLPAAPGQAQVPVLLLAGARDRLVDPACSRRVADAWGAALQVHPTAGHDLPFDDGPWLAEAVRRWASAVLQAAGAPRPPGAPPR
jgi:pimeloyl-ACP methyl ester carboxylesterase